MYKNAQNSKISTTLPIQIPTVKKKSNHSEKKDNIYELKLNLFNPDKCSPPSSWNLRLLDRFHRHSNKILRD